jgi:uncharacterized surface protein with fasciclin (FAS1) repeats
MLLTNSFNGLAKVIIGFVIASFLFVGISISGNAQNEQNILEIAQGNEDLSTFLAAVEKAGLQDVLISEGPNTVFAPTNSAFESLPDGVLEALLMDENASTLVEILTYHVVAQDLNSTQVLEGASFTSVSNGEIAVSQQDGSVFINGDSKLVSVDLDANNGYVHLIDKVLIPTSVDVSTLIANQTDSTPRTGGNDGFILFGGLMLVLVIGSAFGLTGGRLSSVTSKNY